MSNDEWITVNEAAQLSGYNEEHITPPYQARQDKCQKI